MEIGDWKFKLILPFLHRSKAKQGHMSLTFAPSRQTCFYVVFILSESLMYIQLTTSLLWENFIYLYYIHTYTYLHGGGGWAWTDLWTKLCDESGKFVIHVPWFIPFHGIYKLPFYSTKVYAIYGRVSWARYADTHGTGIPLKPHCSDGRHRHKPLKSCHHGSSM